jgi:hypothetical protein
VSDFSASSEKRVECISLTSPTTSTTQSVIGFAAIKGYVTVQYDDFWWLACVMRVMKDSEEVEVSFLHPHGPAKSFKYPSTSDVLVVSSHDILTAVSPSTDTGRVYRLPHDEIITASSASAARRK